MESSRGGPLTTFIMMLPLIVVPTVAMLKPAGDGGILSGLMKAATDRGEPAESNPDDMAEAIWDEIAGTGTSDSDAPLNGGTFDELDAELFSEAVGDAFSESPSDPFRTVSSASGRSASPVEANVEPLLAQLRQMGMTNTLSFDPGDGQSGFVAFFQAPDGRMTYRFESVAQSSPQAIADVLRQVRAWKARGGI